MDNHIEQERVEARKALEVNGLGLPWRVGTASPNGLQNVGTKMGVMVCQTFNKEDAHLIANAPTWLRNSLDREDQLIAEINLLKNVVGESGTLIAEVEWDLPHFESTTESHIKQLISHLRKSELKVAEQDKEIQRYKNALRYYEDEHNYDVHSEEGYTAIEMDRGDVAKQALR